MTTVSKNVNFQDTFLNQMRKENIVLRVRLMDGMDIKGIVRGFDNFTVILEDNKKRQRLIYKHAITMMTPLNDNKESFQEDYVSKK